MAGSVFGEVFLRNKAVEEVKKSIEANDMIMALMTGKNIRAEWKFDETEDYKKLINIVQTINYLTPPQA